MTDPNEKRRARDRAVQAKRRSLWSRQEAKAKSIQASYRQASGNSRTLTLADARLLIANPPTCPYCGKPIPWDELSIDHKQPRSRGGSNEDDNLAWVDLPCNVMKGAMTEEEFKTLRRFMAEHPDLGRVLGPRLKASGFLYRRAA